MTPTIRAAAVLAALAAPAGAQDDLTFYLVSHGGEAIPFWVDWNAGVESACDRMGVTCNVSFSNGDFAVQKEALNSAIASGADGIGATSGQIGLWTEEVALAREQDIPLVFFNSDDPETGRDAFVGADLVMAGRMWAEHMVEAGHVEEGSQVFLPVEVAGASYQQLETQGIAEVFDPLGVEYEVVEVGADPAGSIQRMSEYLIANDVDAIIGLGDLVTANIPQVFQGMGMAPGDVPVVGWGNSREVAQAVRDGYVEAALWQYPAHQGFMTVAMLILAAEGQPIGYDVFTLQTYDAESVDDILDLYAQ